MTLDELIKKLTEIRDSGDGIGRVKVNINCAVGGVNCWVHDDMVRIETREGHGIVVIIEGSIGA